MADLPIIEYIMLKVVELEDSYYYGGAHIFLGAYYSSRPPMFGGKPVESRKITISIGKLVTAIDRGRTTVPVTAIDRRTTTVWVTAIDRGTTTVHKYTLCNLECGSAQLAK